ncbi:Sister chromatid cohesion protein DCC1 [Cricetulus griseus]|uniref:Sister chromatid cohesion protein DCC1 n=1 Tax=Cricetulus griseus TaxID=10029 RepID=G3IQA4_CRIGR|nr:Sister chromatid cohesion protein DCC1 [Cricetulus griseus]
MNLSDTISPDKVYFELDADKICRVTAEMLLQNAVKFNLDEFQEVWQQSVPEGMTTRLDQLKVRLIGAVPGILQVTSD